MSSLLWKKISVISDKSVSVHYGTVFKIPFASALFMFATEKVSRKLCSQFKVNDPEIEGLFAAICETIITAHDVRLLFGDLQDALGMPKTDFNILVAVLRQDRYIAQGFWSGFSNFFFGEEKAEVKKAAVQITQTAKKAEQAIEEGRGMLAKIGVTIDSYGEIIVGLILWAVAFSRVTDSTTRLLMITSLLCSLNIVTKVTSYLKTMVGGVVSAASREYKARQKKTTTAVAQGLYDDAATTVQGFIDWFMSVVFCVTETPLELVSGFIKNYNYKILMGYVRDFSATATSALLVVKFFGWLSKRFKCFILGLSETDYELKCDVENYIDEVSAILKTDIKNKILVDEDKRNTVRMLIHRYEILSKRMRQTDLKVDFHRALHQVGSAMVALRDDVFSNQKNILERVKPIVIYLYGKTGLGKTEFVEFMSTTIARYFHPDYSLSELRSCVLEHNGQSEYFEGYCGQDVFVVNDPFVSRTPAQWESFMINFIGMVGSQPKPLNMANVDKKGKVYFTSPVMIITGNQEKAELTNKTPVHPDAFLRRFDIPIKMSIPADYYRGKRIDSALMKEVTGKVASFELHTFEVYDHHWETAKTCNMREMLDHVMQFIDARCKARRLLEQITLDNPYELKVEYGVPTKEKRSTRNLVPPRTADTREEVPKSPKKEEVIDLTFKKVDINKVQLDPIYDDVPRDLLLEVITTYDSTLMKTNPDVYADFKKNMLHRVSDCSATVQETFSRFLNDVDMRKDVATRFGYATAQVKYERKGDVKAFTTAADIFYSLKVVTEEEDKPDSQKILLDCAQALTDGVIEYGELPEGALKRLRDIVDKFPPVDHEKVADAFGIKVSRLDDPLVALVLASWLKTLKDEKFNFREIVRDREHPKYVLACYLYVLDKVGDRDISDVIHFYVAMKGGSRWDNLAQQVMLYDIEAIYSERLLIPSGEVGWLRYMREALGTLKDATKSAFSALYVKTSNMRYAAMFKVLSLIVLGAVGTYSLYNYWNKSEEEEADHVTQHASGDPKTRSHIGTLRSFMSKGSKVRTATAQVEDMNCDSVIPVIRDNIVHMTWVTHDNREVGALYGVGLKGKDIWTVAHFGIMYRHNYLDIHHCAIHWAGKTQNVAAGLIDMIAHEESSGDSMILRVKDPTFGQFRDITHLMCYDVGDGMDLSDIGLITPENEVRGSGKYNPTPIVVSIPNINERFALTDSVCVSNITTVAGWCGLPYVVRNKKVPKKLFGIHSAYSTGKGAVVCLVRKQIALAQVYTEAMGKTFKPKTYNYINRETQIEASEFQQYLPAPTTLPAELKRRWVELPDGTTVFNEPELNAVKKLQKGKVFTPDELDLRIQDAIIDIKCTDPKSSYVHKLNVHQAINGIAHEFLNPLDMTTSAGYPFSMGGKGKGKEKVFDNQGTPEQPFHVFKPEVQAKWDAFLHDIDETDKDILDIIMDHEVFFADCLKDERRTINKNKYLTPRLFSAGPLFLTILTRMECPCILQDHYKSWDRNGSCIGINAYTPEWQSMIKRHPDHPSLAHCDSDGVNTDASWNNFTGRAALRYWETTFNLSGRRWQFIKTATWLNCHHVIGDTGYITNYQNPSGCALTTQYNNENLRIHNLHVVTRYLIDSKICVDPHKAVRMALWNQVGNFFGDDNIMTFNIENLTGFTAGVYATYSYRYGLELLNAEKNGPPVFHKKLGDCVFLKRNVVTRQLPRRIIEEMLLWKKKRTTFEDWFVGISHSYLTELFLIGTKEYEEGVYILRELLDKIGRIDLSYVIPSKQDLYPIYFAQKAVIREIDNRKAKMVNFPEVDVAVAQMDVIKDEKIQDVVEVLNIQDPEKQSSTIPEELRPPVNPYKTDVIDIMRRKYLYNTVSWTEVQTVGDILEEVDMPDALYSDQPFIKEIMDHYNFLRAGCKFHIVINAPATYYGMLLVSWLPQYADNGTGYFNCWYNIYQQASNWTVLVSAQRDRSIEFTLPFALTRNAVIKSDFASSMLGRLRITVLNPLRNAGSATAARCNLSLYVSFDEPELFGPTYVAQMQTEQEIKSQKGTKSDLYDKVVKVGKEIVYHVSPPVVQGFAKLIGFKPMLRCKSTTLQADMNVEVKTTDMSNMDGQFKGPTITASSTTELANTDPTSDLLNYGEFDNYKLLPSLFRVVTFDSDSETGSVLTTIPVTPFACQSTQETISSISRNVYWTTHIANLASGFLFWRGGLKYSMVINCSKFTTGRLLVLWVPSGALPSFADDIGDCISKVVDFSGTTQESFTIPYMQETYWIQNAGTFAAPSNVNGTFGVYVLNVTTAGLDATPEQVDINFFISGAEDFEVARPSEVYISSASLVATNPYCNAFAQVLQFQSNLREHFRQPFPSLIPSRSATVYNEVIGEKITSFQQLLSRPSRLEIRTQTSSTGAIFAIDPVAQTCQNATTWLSTSTNISPMMQRVFTTFRFFRGKLRYHIIPISTSLSIANQTIMIANASDQTIDRTVPDACLATNGFALMQRNQNLIHEAETTWYSLNTMGANNVRSASTTQVGLKTWSVSVRPYTNNGVNMDCTYWILISTSDDLILTWPCAPLPVRGTAV